MFRAFRYGRWLLPVMLTACLAPPDLPPRQAASDVESPRLLPLSVLLAQGADGPNAPRLTDAPDARAAALRARAARLRGQVIASGERQRMLGSDARLR